MKNSDLARLTSLSRSFLGHLTPVEKHGWNLFAVEDLIVAGDGLKAFQFQVL